MVACVVVAGAALTGAVAPIGPSTTLAAVTPGCVVDTSGLIGWWRGEDGLTAEIGPDLQGTAGFDGGIVGQGMVLDPTRSASTSALDTLTTALTVEMWIRPISGASGVQSLATRWEFPSQDDAARTFSLTLMPEGRLVFETDETTLRRPEVLSGQVPNVFDGAFHHVAATWDSQLITLYFDGAPIATAPSQGGLLNPVTTTLFRLGAKSGLGDPFWFTGVMDEPSVWNRALTASEVGAIQNAGSAGKCSFVPVEQAKLTASTAAGNDRFGTSVGVNATTAVVGAPFSSQLGQFAGTAYVYTFDGVGWSEQAKLTATDTAIGDRNGWSVDVEGDTIVTGSYANDAGGLDSGAAYIFSRSGATWSQQAKFVPADAAAGDGIGYSVAIDGDTAVVASVSDDDAGSNSGSAYVFVRSGGVWSQQAKLVAGDADVGDNFGTWIDVDGDTVIVGAAGDNDGAIVNTGSAYVFTRSATTWSQQAKLVAADAAAGDQFGYGVTIDGDIVAVGAPFDDDAGADSGAAYVFTRSGGTWSQEAKLTAADAASPDRFGSSVATNGSVVVIGAPRDGVSGSQSGSAYVFSRSGTSWSETTKLIPADNATGDQFGISVAISGDVIVGAHNDDDAGNNSGSAYVFAP